MNKKVIAVALALVLAVTACVAGTFAWLTVKTNDVVNTFTTGNIGLTLEETEGGENHEFHMVPGKQLAKDPMITVDKASEDCWLFVKIEEVNNEYKPEGATAGKRYLEYSIATGWTQGTGVDGNGVPENVYYRVVTFDRSDPDNPPVDFVAQVLQGDSTIDGLENGFVTVNEDVDKVMMEAARDSGLPKLVITAYACQYEVVADAQIAWGLLNPSETTPPATEETT